MFRASCYAPTATSPGSATISRTWTPTSPAGSASPPPDFAYPAPSKAEIKRSHDSKVDKPARGATAIKDVRVGHLKKALSLGHL
ncbi:hypothetical protein GCM10017600_27420 [Streptosporangium carneum]|uniref:Uncharacterized protein n=1 Tax=Streptosporangium carneum TaxID=47481 RepID=A0A9W6I0S4_9ACTN|nr:hypothetical protein GCM10017600_27420 [Streptosporangium carneum]